MRSDPLAALLIGSAANIRAVEDRIGAAETRLPTLQNNEDTVRRSLNSRRAVIAEVLAALQRVGRRPPDSSRRVSCCTVSSWTLPRSTLPC